MDDFPDFSRLNRELLAYAYRRIGNLQRAEDAVQDVYVRACRNHPRTNGWFFRCLRSVLIDNARGNRKGEWLEIGLDLDAEDYSQTEDAILASILLSLGMSCLTADQVKLIRLELDGFNHAEIGQILGKTENAVKSLQHRAFAAFAKGNPG